MRRRALLICTILLGAVWAAAAFPATAQAQQGPPPHVELPKDKKPKPEKPDSPPGQPVPSPPLPPPAPEPPDEPPAETEPPPVETEEPPATGGGGGTGGGAPGGGAGAEPRAPEPPAGQSVPPATSLRAAAPRGRVAGSREDGGFPRTSDSIASVGVDETGPGVEIATRESLGVSEATGSEAAGEPAAAAVAEDEAAGIGVVPLALLAAGLVLLTVGLAVGFAQARTARL